MNDPWVGLRRLLDEEYILTTKTVKEGILADADALLASVRKLQEHQSNIPLILEGDNAIEVAQWFDQGIEEALAALPEYLRGESDGMVSDQVHKL